MKDHAFLKGCMWAAVLMLAGMHAAFGISINGNVANQSVWLNNDPDFAPPGDSSGFGTLIVGVWNSESGVIGLPYISDMLITYGPLPLGQPATPYQLGSATNPLPDDTYVVKVWVDGNGDGQYDLGEPCSADKNANIQDGEPVVGLNFTCVDDSDADSLPDWWEAHWFSNLLQEANTDPDNDSLTTYKEYSIGMSSNLNMKVMNPAHWDTDQDGMDDGWEYRYSGTIANKGLNPTVADHTGDDDGDGLSDWQEYCGMDGIPLMVLGSIDGVIRVGALGGGAEDALNPLDVDTDRDLLVDSFEFAWYAPEEGISPLEGTNDYENASADPDMDGLSNFREQCLLTNFWQTGVNSNMWMWNTGTPYPYEFYLADDGDTVRIAKFSMSGWGQNLDFSVDPDIAASTATNLFMLRQPSWTDPSEASGYLIDAGAYPGHDTDGDGLPDGWEVDYNLDPRQASGANGYYGDPDSDGLVNVEEYLGQDGNRSTNKPYINGTGDETNPNEHNWSPPSTGGGLGIARPMIATNYWDTNTNAPAVGTLGAALPTTSLGVDIGLDTDEDGIDDNTEMQQEYYTNVVGSSPVQSMSPFIKRSIRITSSNGIPVPDPEGAVYGYSPDLHARDWTIECYVKLLDADCNGYLINNQGPRGLANRLTYRMELSNNIPIVSFDTLGGYRYNVYGPGLPTNRWIHLAGVWDHAQNSLSLYVDGVFEQQQRVYQEAQSSRPFGSADPVRIGSSEDASFVDNLLMDEIRIWGTARTATEIETYRRQLVPQTSDWLQAYYRFDDGGVTAENFARKARNSLLDAESRDYLYGDHGYALNSGYTLLTNEYAPVFGVDQRGADDSSGDGMPDDWKMINHLDPFSTNGINGASGDPDGDGLVNLYEYWAGTNPWAQDSDQNGVLDGYEDFDGDHVANLIEQELGSRPDMQDTDDDGQTDNLEQSGGTNPADPTDPPLARGMQFAGTAQDYLDIPIAFKQRLTDWTLEAWVKPTNSAHRSGSIIRRVVQNLPSGADAVNYMIAVTNGMARGGYVLADGREFILSGGSVPVDQWTHIAATYNKLNAALTLYVNGTVVSNVNNFFDTPPINGKGGETFVRIGEAFDGVITEVRVWDYTRSGDSIDIERTEIVDGKTTGLINYFRFDDGQAVTNEFPFGLYHEPHGPQDFTVKSDWNNQWRSAADMVGNVQFRDLTGDTPVNIPPTVHVILGPQEAIDAGAQWSVDGAGWNASGDWVISAEGTHTLIYKSLDGWARPSDETVILSNGTATTLTRYYQRTAQLTVVIEPEEVVTAGAMFRLDSGEWLSSGQTIEDIAPGAHRLEFLPVNEWIPPAEELLNIGEGDTLYYVRSYQPDEGMLTVNIEPNAAISAGAQWRIDEGAWQSSGLTVPLPSGTYSIDFKSITGWVKPSAINAIITNDIVTTIDATYYQYEYIGSYGQGLGQFYKPSGVAVDTNSNLYVAEEGNNRIQRYNMTSLVWTAWGSAGVAHGQFNQPLGIALGPDYRKFYVADANNHRIQCYDLQLDTWTVWGDGALGTGQGQFNTPFDVELDSAGNLYVADLYNNRVQRMSPLGTWSTFIQSGSWEGGVRMPRGVSVNRDNHVFVSDYIGGGEQLSRVQEFDASGGFLLTVASSTNSQWSITKPAGISMRGQTRYFIADSDNNRVLWYNPASNLFGEVLGSDILNDPRDVAVDDQGNLYIADTLHHRIVKLRSAVPSVSYSTNPVPVPGTNPFLYRNDFDGSGSANPALYWPAGGTWYMYDINTASGWVVPWGWGDTLPVPGDYDGDGTADAAVYWPAGGMWYILQSSTSTLLQRNWGWADALPVAGDYDGDGITDMTVYWPAAGNWYTLRSSDATMKQQNWGWTDAEPVPGDYDGDGRSDYAVYWPYAGTWYIRMSDGSTDIQALGDAQSIPAPGDYDGDHKADIAVYSPSDGTWYVIKSWNNTLWQYPWGWDATTPVPGDYDGDGLTDLAVYWSGGGMWYILRSSDDVVIQLNWGWGAAQAVP